MIDIVPIKALSDNYIWLLTTNEGSILVDPGESKKIIDLIEDEAIDLKGILITHHHYDHTNGLNDILKIKQVDVYGPQNNISEINKIVKEGDKFSICGIQFEVIEVPGHTLDHIAFNSINSEKNILFCGDTLFFGGCGRVFEGTYEQMFSSLNKLSSLPSDTLVYCGHEYTASNLKFALEVDPSNDELKKEFNKVLEMEHMNRCTLPSSIKKEHALNPFFRCNNLEIQNKITNKFKVPNTEIEIFKAIRKWKDNY